LRPQISAADAFKTIARTCVRHFRLNERLLIETRDPEALHQCRVALRRLRSALSVFKEVIADDEIADLKGRLRTISQDLGGARDLDVFLAKLNQPDGSLARPDVEDRELLERTRKDREDAYSRVIAALQDQRFHSLMFDVIAWIETGPWLHADDPMAQVRRQQPVERFAAETLDRRRRKVRRRGRHLEELDPSARHRVRIEAKKLRYATEFFASLATGRKNQRRQQAFSKALEDLQEHLGELNDLATSDKIAREAARQTGNPAKAGSRSGHPPKPEEPPASGESREIKRSLAAATSAFRDFAEAKPFWPSGSVKKGTEPDRKPANAGGRPRQS
jgi:CHAD domain-containing protein